MYRDGDTLVLERKDCGACASFGDPELFGTTSKRVTCPVCGGDGRGPRGGRRGCKRCHGSGKTYDVNQRVPCPRCSGDWEDAEDETIYDDLPREIVEDLEFRVYRNEKRQQSMAEALIGVGLGSTTDYGRHKSMSDDELIAKVRERVTRFTPQALKVVDNETLKFPDHIGIFTSSQGYSIRAVHTEPDDVEKDIERERGYREGLMLGARMAEAGLNGTLGALYKDK